MKRKLMQRFKQKTNLKQKDETQNNKIKFLTRDYYYNLAYHLQPVRFVQS